MGVEKGAGLEEARRAVATLTPLVESMSRGTTMMSGEFTETDWDASGGILMLPRDGPGSGEVYGAYSSREGGERTTGDLIKFAFFSTGGP